MRKKLHEEQIKKLVIITLIIFSFLIGFGMGALFGVKATINNVIEFMEDSDINIDINFNETRMIDTMMDRIESDPRYNPGDQ